MNEPKNVNLRTYGNLKVTLPSPQIFYMWNSNTGPSTTPLIVSWKSFQVKILRFIKGGRAYSDNLIYFSS